MSSQLQDYHLYPFEGRAARLPLGALLLRVLLLKIEGYFKDALRVVER